MKKQYTEPDVEVIRIEEDVICTSGGGSGCSYETPCLTDED